MIRELRVALDRTAEIVAAIPEDRSGDPTPCPELDVRGLTNHLVAGNISFAGAANGDGFDFSLFQQDHLGDDPAGAFRQSAEMAIAAWQRPGVLDEKLGMGDMPGSAVIRMHLAEELVHGWDLAVATDQSREIDATLAAIALEMLRAVPEAMLRGPAFGPEVELAADASTGDALVAFLGRDPASPIGER